MSAHAISRDKVFSRDNIYLSEGAGSGIGKFLIGVGLACIGLTVFLAFLGDKTAAKAALHAYHAGFLYTVGVSLGALGFVMIFHQTNAGWVATIRRQFENVMSLVWVGGLLFIFGMIFQLLMNTMKGAYLFDWMDASYVEGDLLYEHKQGFLNIPFFYVRVVLYFAVWLGLAFSLWGYSTRQDENGDKWETAKARGVSSVGLLLFAFTVAFAGFDWIMALDYHWFSTMLGVYFFAGNAVSCLATVILILLTLRAFGRLHVAFTEEHLHDLSKLLFAFTVFWAYISFSQYFLIWYANIPEETAWMLRRKEGVWEWLSWLMPIGHFIVPFLFLLPRPIRRTRGLIFFACLWMLIMHGFDLYWAVRPEVVTKDGEPFGPRIADFFGIVGPVLVFAGFLFRKVASGPLVPLHDPRIPEALIHKNYV